MTEPRLMDLLILSPREILASFASNYSVSVRRRSGYLILHESDYTAIGGIAFVLSGLLVLAFTLLFFLVIDPAMGRSSPMNYLPVMALTLFVTPLVMPVIIAMARYNILCPRQGRWMNQISKEVIQMESILMFKTKSSEHNITKCLLTLRQVSVDVPKYSGSQWMVVLNMPHERWRLCNYTDRKRSIDWLLQSQLEDEFGECLDGPPIRIAGLGLRD